MNHLSECDQFQDHRRAICRGERADLPLDGPNSVNAYRVLWGLCPLPSPGPQPSPRRPSGPASSLLQQVTTFAGALTEHIKDGLTKCDDTQIQTRLAICQQCPEFTGTHCRKCGCACNGRSKFFNKLAWRSESCPLDKWSAGDPSPAPEIPHSQ